MRGGECVGVIAARPASPRPSPRPRWPGRTRSSRCDRGRVGVVRAEAWRGGAEVCGWRAVATGKAGRRERESPVCSETNTEQSGLRQWKGRVFMS
ncbi:hypothetical protein E2C01_036155 [Portunus trituberculatus]|uniref:Uncharacterized protein n=1 Tax=Portunus trituberculatus TaxID=210409 RepID=A0A5B7F7Y5_PORTR|nr:hypothetical protein [Portunus trituberculatus]